MSLFVTSLNSGSNGNCYYIGNSTDAVLVDVGLTCRETEKRMAALGLSMDLIRAIFISHEHTDHIKGLTAIAEKYDLPVYITNKTAGNSFISKNRLRQFKTEDEIQIEGLTIVPFTKFHDAADPHSFIIKYNNITVGVFTDIGRPCTSLKKYFSLCHAAFLESNYDDDLLENGAYPIFLKNRIRGGLGHLSNNQALEVFLQHRPAFLSHLFLSHLSKDNNCPEKVKELFRPHARGTEIIIASRYSPTPVYNICGTAPRQYFHPNKRLARKKVAENQLSFF
ncbi:MAG: MBL fold metallo-hydrolase [Ginsengibacter sp.]